MGDFIFSALLFFLKVLKKVVSGNLAVFGKQVECLDFTVDFSVFVRFRVLFKYLQTDS